MVWACNEERHNEWNYITRVLDIDIATVSGLGRIDLEWKQTLEKDVSQTRLLSEDVLDRPRL